MEIRDPRYHINNICYHPYDTMERTYILLNKRHFGLCIDGCTVHRPGNPVNQYLHVILTHHLVLRSWILYNKVNNCQLYYTLTHKVTNNFE
ncbi:hypothetical protein QTP88_022047 [Uroleucon formosanum]